MPYKIEIQGIYKIINKKTNQCYVGQSSNIKKRLSEHFRLLRLNKHPNKHLQNAYNKYGSENFVGEVEIECESFEDMDMLENLFINGEASFEEAVVYNIADFAKAPMRGKKHTEEARERIRLGRRATTFDYNDPDYLKKLSEAQLARYRRDPKFLARLKFIVENDHMTYAERGKLTGICTSSARKLFLKYAHLKGVL